MNKAVLDRMRKAEAERKITAHINAMVAEQNKIIARATRELDLKRMRGVDQQMRKCPIQYVPAPSIAREETLHDMAQHNPVLMRVLRRMK